MRIDRETGRPPTAYRASLATVIKVDKLPGQMGLSKPATVERAVGVNARTGIQATAA